VLYTQSQDDIQCFLEWISCGLSAGQKEKVHRTNPISSRTMDIFERFRSVNLVFIFRVPQKIWLIIRPNRLRSNRYFRSLHAIRQENILSHGAPDFCVFSSAYQFLRFSSSHRSICERHVSAIRRSADREGCPVIGVSSSRIGTRSIHLFPVADDFG